MRIYKYPLEAVSEQTLKIEGLQQILSAQVQGESPYLWVEVDLEDKHVHEVRIGVRATGEDFPDMYRSFIGTIQLFGGRLVYHVYQL